MITCIAVVVPAKDEQDEIRGCLESVAGARRRLHDATGGRVASRAVVVLDDCRDTTAEVVAGISDLEVLSTHAGSVGAARRVGAAHVLAAGAARSLWLASTDADSRVPPDWLVRMVAHADAGADLVLGTVRPAGGLSEPVYRAWLGQHHLGDGHPHVHAANLGIRASSYAELGGWRSRDSDEDVDLVRRAEESGRMRIHRCGDVVVVTSSRLTGRAPRGFAGYLRSVEAASGEAG